MCVSVLAGGCIECDAFAADLREDLIGRCGPLERFRILVVSGEVGLDRVDQVRDGVEIPRRIALSLKRPKKISTLFSHELEVGVKCSKRGCLVSAVGRKSRLG